MNPAAQRKALLFKGTPEELLGDGHPVRTIVALPPQQDEKGKEQQVQGAMPVPNAQLDNEPRYTWGSRLTASANAGPNARLRVRTRLTVARWSGNVDAAARVADKLVDNAYRHAEPIGPGEGWIELRLTVLPTTDELLIEVDDATPEFADFDKAATTEPKGASARAVVGAPLPGRPVVGPEDGRRNRCRRRKDRRGHPWHKWAASS
ncbi:hypothetical protein [Streptomyces sp. Tue6028]|uniref:hypothetical protein n=1 Tax=Streptomyces sp. Tue6028 TaxID=2036037 RepID=UPI003D70648A